MTQVQQGGRGGAGSGGGNPHRRGGAGGPRGSGGGSRANRRPRDTFAALDLGTNNCRLLVAHPLNDGFRVIDAFSRIVRLGEGLSANGRLSEAAIERTLAALQICARKMERRGVTHARAVATEACRRAENCQDFVERVQEETGLELEIITNSEEASLGLYGCAPLLVEGPPYALIFDIGGGSTEVSWLRVKGGRAEGGRASGGRALKLEPELLEWVSLPMGVVTLAEAFGGRDITPAVYHAMVETVSKALAPFEASHGLARLAEAGEIQMLGTSGTVTTLSGIDLCLPRYERARVDGSFLDFERIDKLCRLIARMSYDQRVAHPCIGLDRADLVVAGCAILEAICRTWPCGRLRVADRGLREGILFSLLRRREQRRLEARERQRLAAGLAAGANLVE